MNPGQLPVRLLIVDDDEATTQTFAQILTFEGYEVRTASNADMGLRDAEVSPPDAIIVDLRMPFINGLGFLYRLRERVTLQHTPVVMVTGDQCLEDAVISEARELGADVQFKPLWEEDLAKLAKTLIGDRQKIRSQSTPNRLAM
jgi:DNA-binding response OmpR family regulator